MAVQTNPSFGPTEPVRPLRPTGEAAPQVRRHDRACRSPRDLRPRSLDRDRLPVPNDGRTGVHDGTRHRDRGAASLVLGRPRGSGVSGSREPGDQKFKLTRGGYSWWRRNQSPVSSKSSNRMPQHLRTHAAICDPSPNTRRQKPAKPRRSSRSANPLSSPVTAPPVRLEVKHATRLKDQPATFARAKTVEPRPVASRPQGSCLHDPARLPATNGFPDRRDMPTWGASVRSRPAKSVRRNTTGSVRSSNAAIAEVAHRP